MKHTLASFTEVGAFALAFLCTLAPQAANAVDTSAYIDLTRYTLVDDSTFRHETGFLHLDNTFHVIASSIEYYDVWGLWPDYIAPFSGKPMMSVEAFNSCQPAGLIPHWIRSRDTYPIGFDSYVAVAVKGKGDPNPTITITEQPQSQVAAVGESAFFYVSADPILYLSYQWKFKGKNLPGQTTFFLMLTNVTAAQAGIYTVALSTGSKPILTKPALLKVDKPVVIKTPPKSQAIKTGKSVVFRVTALGSAPFQYQWYWNGQAITNATKPFYTIPHVGSTNAGTYGVMVSNPVSFDYGSATLTVSP